MSVITVDNNTPNIVVSNPTTTINYNTTNSDIIVNPSAVKTITTISSPSIITEHETSSVVITGQVGPRGASYEDFEVYAKRIDFITDSLLYKGEAVAGSLDTNPVWRIRKITIASDSDVSETWAGGTDAFINIWANRLALSYV